MQTQPGPVAILRTFRLLNVRRLRAHPLRALVAILSVAAGVSLAASVLVVRESIHRSVSHAGRSFAGPATFRVIGPATRGGLAAETLPRVQAVDGVRTAVPLIQAITPVTDAGGDSELIIAVGYDCTIEAIVGSFGCSQRSIDNAESDAAIVSSRLYRELGEDLTIGTDLGPHELRGPSVEQLDDVNSGRVVAYPMPVAQRLFARPDRYDAIYVVPEARSDTSALRADLVDAAGEHNVILDAAEPPPGLANLLVLLPLLGVISLTALAVGGILVYNTVSLTLAERRRDLAVASALGGTRSTLFAGTLAESVALGAIGGLVGSVAGVALAPTVLSGFREHLQRVAGGDITVHTPWTVYAAGVLLGALVAAAAAIGPVRRALRFDVVDALRVRSATTEPLVAPSGRRAFASLSIGLLGIGLSRVAVAGGGLAHWQPILGGVALLLVTITLFVSAGAVAPWALHHARRTLSPHAGVLKLALTNLVREPRRTAVMVIATTSAVGMAFSIASAGRMVRIGITEARIAETAEGVWLSTVPRNNGLNIDSKLPPELVDRLRTFPGVAVAGTGLTIGVHTDDGPLLGAAGADVRTANGGPIAPPLPFEVLRGTADPHRFERGEVLIGPSLARNRKIGPGDLVRIPGLHGMVDVRVQGVWANGDFNGNEISMPTWLLERIWGPQPTESMSLVPSAGVSAAELVRAIEAADLHPDLTATTPTQQRTDTASDLESFLAPFWALQRAMLAIAFAAVLFTLLLAAIQRRREMGLLAAVGLAPEAIGRMVVGEALVVAVSGTVLGALGGVATADAFRNSFFLTVPYRLPLLFDLKALAVYGALAVVLLAAAAGWPAWRSARIDVAEALRYE